MHERHASRAHLAAIFCALPLLLQVGLYHYAIKSLDDFIQKMARGSGMGNVKTIAFFEVGAHRVLSRCCRAAASVPLACACHDPMVCHCAPAVQYVDNFTDSYCPDALDVGLQLNNLMALQEAL